MVSKPSHIQIAFVLLINAKYSNSWENIFSKHVHIISKKWYFSRKSFFFHSLIANKSFKKELQISKHVFLLHKFPCQNMCQKIHKLWLLFIICIASNGEANLRLLPVYFLYKKTDCLIFLFQRILFELTPLLTQLIFPLMIQINRLLLRLISWLKIITSTTHHESSNCPSIMYLIHLQSSSY